MGERSVCAAIVGLPNVGKSTLINALIGEKLAIVSPKPQTTRTRILGVVNRGETQFVYLDTPGFHLPRTRLGEHMVKTVRDSAADVDCAVFVTWAKTSLEPVESELLAALRKAGVPVILAINKCDAFKNERDGEHAMTALSELFDFESALAVSALRGDNLDALADAVERHAVESPHLYDEDSYTDMPERVIAAELIRETLLACLSDELPHGCAVNVEAFKEREGRDIIDIDAEIISEKSSHKGMIIGKGGAMLKRIGTDSRLKLEDFLGCRVNLKLWVKVREGWRDNESRIRSFGL